MRKASLQQYLLVAILGATVSCCGVARPPAVAQPPPQLSKSTVLALARKEAMDARVNLQLYKPPRIEYRADAHEWQVSYAGKAGGIDNCFLIFVNDKTKKAAFLACG